MATLFESIIAGDVPGRFVWADDQCVAFATIEPTSPGHVLVVPRSPYPKWTDAPAPVAAAAAGAQEGRRGDQEDGGAAASEPGGAHNPISHLAESLVALKSSTRS